MTFEDFANKIAEALKETDSNLTDEEINELISTRLDREEIEAAIAEGTNEEVEASMNFATALIKFLLKEGVKIGEDQDETSFVDSLNKITAMLSE